MDVIKFRTKDGMDSPANVLPNLGCRKRHVRLPQRLRAARAPVIAAIGLSISTL